MAKTNAKARTAAAKTLSEICAGPAAPVGWKAAPTDELPPMFEPFSWTTPEADEASHLNQLQAISRARDIAFGVANVLEMLEREELDDECEDETGRPYPKLFDCVVRGNLKRLAIASLQMLGATMDAEIDRANRNAEMRADT